MGAVPYGPQAADWQESPEPDETFVLPQRPRRRFGGWRTWLLGSVIVGGLCFYAGVRVEKGQLSSSSTAGAGAFASRLSAALGGGRSGSTASTGGAAASTGGAAASTGGASASGGGAAGGAGFFGGGARGGLGGGGGTFGTVSSVRGGTIYITELSGTTVAVKVPKSSQITKSQTVGRSAIRPGDTVVVQGVTGAGGTVTAATVTDTGSRAGGGSSAGATGSGATGSGTSAGSALDSLFGSGSGG